MGRRKLKMELISKKKTRLVTYEKRKQCLMKKAYEFATLCDVGTCVILYGPKLQNDTQEVETWPKNQEQVRAVIDGYRSTIHSDTQGKRNQGVADYYTNPMRKLQDQIGKVNKENMGIRFLKWDNRLDLFSHDQLRFVEAELDLKLESAKQRLSMLTNQQLLNVSFQRLPPLADFHNNQHIYSFQNDQSLNAVPFGFPGNNFSSMLSSETDDPVQFHSDYLTYGNQVSNPINQVIGQQYYSPGLHMAPSYGQNLQTNPDDFPRIQAPPQFSGFMNPYEMNFLNKF